MAKLQPGYAAGAMSSPGGLGAFTRALRVSMRKHKRAAAAATKANDEALRNRRKYRIRRMKAMSA